MSVYIRHEIHLNGSLQPPQLTENLPLPQDVYLGTAGLSDEKERRGNGVCIKSCGALQPCFQAFTVSRSTDCLLGAGIVITQYGLHVAIVDIVSDNRRCKTQP